MTGNPVSAHPNASLAGGTGGIGVLAVWLLNKYAGASLGPEAGAAITAGLATVALVIGRKGIKGIAGWVWRGGG